MKVPILTIIVARAAWLTCSSTDLQDRAAIEALLAGNPSLGSFDKTGMPTNPYQDPPFVPFPS